MFREVGTFSEICTKNLGHLWEKEDILKAKFSKDKLQLMYIQVLKDYYIKHFADLHSLYFDITLNTSKNEVVHMQSHIKWY